jgi:prepilin signal peptidase PulO-like enzyme (type II secretory pathway)
MMVVLFLFGLGIGSFLNVLIWRLNDEKAPKFWQGRSLCPHCRHQLSWKDNLPLLSFFLLGGKCRYCRKKISFHYPLVEAVAGMATAMIGFSPVNLIIAYCFIVIFFSDWIYGLIPDEATVILAILGLVLNFGNWPVGLGAFGVLLILYAATRGRGVGFGDVKLVFPLGLLLGWPKILAMGYAASLLGGGYALILLLLRRKKFGDTIALGPFLIIGAVIALCAPVTPLLKQLLLFP